MSDNHGSLPRQVLAVWRRTVHVPTVPARWWLDGLTRRATYTAGLVSELVSALATSTVPQLAKTRRSRLQRLQQADGHDLTRRAGGFISFRTTILGCTKQQVCAALGPPRAAALHRAEDSVITSRFNTFAALDEWYYAFDLHRRAAVAVRFSLGRVRRVEFINSLERFSTLS